MLGGRIIRSSHITPTDGSYNNGKCLDRCQDRSYGNEDVGVIDPNTDSPDLSCDAQVDCISVISDDSGTYHGLTISGHYENLDKGLAKLPRNGIKI